MWGKLPIKNYPLSNLEGAPGFILGLQEKGVCDGVTGVIRETKAVFNDIHLGN